MKKIFFFLTALALSLTACHKHDATDVTAPTVTISAPSTDAIVKVGTTLNITAKATDETAMHEVAISITKDNNKELFSKTIDALNLTTKDIAETWTPTGFTDDTEVMLTIRVIDHGGNENSKSVKFKIVK